MNRLASRSVLIRGPLLSGHRQTPNIRHQSSGSGGGGGGKFLVTATVALAGLAGGTVGYASYDKEFRGFVQDNVPGSKDILDQILGDEVPKVTKKADTSAPPSKMKMQITSTPPMPEIEKPPPAAAAPPVHVKKEKPVVKDEPKKPVKVAEEKKKEEPKSDPAQAEITGLEFALEEAVKQMNDKVKKALESSKTSIEATKDHMALVRSVMDDDNPKDEKKAWNEVFEAANKKASLLKETDQALSEAKATLSNTIDSIEKGRKNPVTQSSQMLKLADEEASTALKDLEKVVSALDAVKKEAKLIDEYRGLVEEGRQQFQKEIEAILPGMNLSQKSGGLSEEELNIFMTHAYRKVCQLQEELAKAQTFSKRSSSTPEGTSDVQSELDAQRRELEVEHHRKLTALRDEMEKEMRTQLRRQAAAHADHINDVLDVQAKELKRLHERSLDEALSNETSSQKRELAAIKGSLEGLNKSMEDKSFMANATFESQQFWLACIALQKSVESGAKKEVIDAKIKTIEAAIKGSVAFEKDDLIKTLLESIPKNQGVPAKGEIKSRFNKVEEMAKRTALVGEEGGSLLLYGLSYLQSLFVIAPSKTTATPKKCQPIDVEALNTFDIVWLARRSIESDDIEQAVKYMNLLKGEPRKQASDWLGSARLYLEMQQISEALASYATAVGAEAVPSST